MPIIQTTYIFVFVIKPLTLGEYLLSSYGLEIPSLLKIMIFFILNITGTEQSALFDIDLQILVLGWFDLFIPSMI